MTKRLTMTLVALVLFVLIAVLPASAIAANPATGLYNGSVIMNGAPLPTVFIGEDQLNLTPIFGNMAAGGAGDYVIPAGTVMKIGWWAPGTFSYPMNPSQVIDISTRYRTFMVSPTDFGPYTGTWYCLTANNSALGPAFIVADPSQVVAAIDVAANGGQGQDMTGKSVVRGTVLTIKIDTNLAAFTAGGRSNNITGYLATYGPIDTVGTWAGNNLNFTPNATSDGFITIKLKTESGQIHTSVIDNTWVGLWNTSTSLANRWVGTQPWYLGNFTGNNGAGAIGWATDALDPGLGIAAYPAGTYTIWTESSLSRMKDNYKLNGADYTGKTVSAAGTVTLVSDTVKIEANKESVVRSKPFSVTITGRPLTTYWVWVTGTSSMSGAWNNQPPMVGLSQAAVYTDPVTTLTWPLGQYQPENSVTNIMGDVALDPTMYNRTRYYCLINTSSSGTRIIEFVTTNWTKAQTYTIRVERDSSMPNQGTGVFVNPTQSLRDYIGDEVDVKVEKGAVTITAAGDQSYYLGEDIKFSGTNTETQTTFLFLTGPNLWSSGSRFYPAAPSLLDPRKSTANDNSKVLNTNEGTFVRRDVNADNTWDWKWGTANYALDAGTYTVYAVSGPSDADHLGNVAYGTVSIIIKKPFVSATASQSTVAKNDKLFITGTAEGKPQVGIAIWILGKNYALRTTQSVNSDASFSYEVTRTTTDNMDAGQYFIVVQHPMQNQQFDITLCPDNTNLVCNLQQGTVVLPAVASTTQKIFTLLGQGSLQGTDAAEALVQGINTPNVDDTYTKLVFLVEVPSIRIDPVGDRHVGDKFTITATTNLAVDDEVLFEVVSSSFKPTQKSQSGEFSGASGTVKVTKGDTGLNKLSFDVDASTFKPDEYIVNAKWVLKSGITGTALFNVLEGAAPTAVPTAVVTTAGPTVAPTNVETPVPTATPTKTPTQPGFGALVALIGLGAVAFFVVRRH